MARFAPLLALVLIAACGSKDADDTDPGPTTTAPPTDTEDTGPTTAPPTDTAPPTEPVDLCPALGPAAGATVVQPGESIQAALDAAAPGEVIALADGTWPLTAPIVIRRDGVTLRSESGDPASVILDGGYGPSELIRVTASDVTVAGLTLTGAASSGILVRPEAADIGGITLEHLVSVDHAGVHVVVDADGTGTLFADEGEVRCSAFELTDAGRSRVFGVCDTGGVHVRRARGWAVRDNHLEGFWCAGGPSGHAIRFHEGTRDAMIERNTLVDVANGIALGLTNLPTGRVYDDAPCGGATAQDFGGTVRNNSVYGWDSGMMESASGQLLGIQLQAACDATVLHNTLYGREGFVEAAISYRYATTSGVVANNLCTGTLRRLDDAAVTVSTNIETATDLAFVHVQGGDVHLSPAAADYIDQADPSYTVADDIDGQARDAAPDIGADEIVAR